MPDSGPYSLLILSFAVFSFVAWQLRGRNFTALGVGSGLLMVGVATRLAIGHLVHVVALPPESPDLALASFDAVLTVSFLVLVTSTAVTVLTFAVTADPLPK